VSTSSGKQDRPRFLVLPGGRSDDDAGGADWQAFCQRIGWQQLTEPALPDDYEEQLAARIFAPTGGKLVSLEVERGRRRAASPPLPVLRAAAVGGAGRPRRADRGGLGWQVATIAALVMVGLGVAWLAWGGTQAPAQAQPVPTPVPERAPAPLRPGPVDAEPERAPEPAPTVPDPGVRRAERPPVAPSKPQQTRQAPRGLTKVAQVVDVAAPQRQVAAPRPVAGYRISPEGEPYRKAMPSVSLPSPPWLPVQTASHPTIRLASQPASGRAPAWRHLAMVDPGTGAQTMALVDVFQLDRRLGEAL
jgi:hypothetical protein